MEDLEKTLKKMSLGGDFLQKAKLYVSLLKDYTKIHNITALKNDEEIFQNIIDSIYPIKYLDFPIKNIADIGSGAGFPGLHLALAMPHIEVNLYEPLLKKSAFLHLAKTKLDLKNLQVRSMRIEKEKDKSYDLVVSRAVTHTKSLLNLCKNISDERTSFLLYKGTSVDEELDAKLDFKIYKRGNRKYVLIRGKK
ncbi:MAG: 16S rRNA (guanine(527)-N(7))-methyltransferase RsmG [Proteobacteria bacterium]|nr:MAG: 16S rRNA (guanine(527)-N(7))-methyltransferase RsmG [Pseudomonadota bacterium]